MAEAGADDTPPTGPLSERLVNKNWKWRVAAYEELEKLFQTAEDGNAPAFNEYGPLFKKILADSNAIAQEKGLDPLIAFCDRCDNVNRHAGSIAPVLVEKCLGSARPKTKDKAVQALLMIIEADSPEPVVENLIKGCANKVPKVSATSISTLREALRLFGAQVVPIKPLMKEFPAWFENRDKGVRAEASQMVVEMYRWLGKALNNAVESLNPVQAKELQESFEKLPQEPVVPVKYMRSQVPKPGQLAKGGAAPAPQPIDPYDLMDAVNVLAKIKDDWFESLASPKWQIRGEALDKLIEITTNPRLEQGDYGEIAKSLKKCLGDANVVVVSKAAKAIGLLGAGLRTGFSSQAKVLLPVLLEKLKEKKLAVAAALNEALDILGEQCFTLLDVMEDVVAACGNKVPQVREGTLNWIARALFFAKQIPNVPKCVKPLANMLVGALDDGTSDVRDAAAKTFGTLALVVGERAISGYIAKLDPIKAKKVKDSTPQNIPPAAAAALAAPPAPTPSESSNNNNTSEPPKALKKAPSMKKEEKKEEKKEDKPIEIKEDKKPAIARPPSRGEALSEDSSSTSSSSEPPKAAPSKRVAPPTKKAAPAKAAAAKPAAGGKPAAGAKDKGKAKGPEEDLNPTLTKDEALEKASAAIPNVFTLLEDKNWKQRLAGIEELSKAIDGLGEEQLSENSEAIVLSLSQKPGWKESNFQVLSQVFLAIGKIAKLDPKFSRKTAAIALEGLGEKLADIKISKAATECLLDFTEATCPQFVFSQLYQSTAGHKNPKVTSEALNWMLKALEEFGTGSVDVKMMIDHLKGCLESTNAPTKTAATKVLVVMRISLGPSLSDFLSDVKKQLLDSIEKEFDKVKDAKPNPPNRTFREAPRGGSGGGAVGELPRSDVSGKIKEKLLKDLADPQWKTRQAALEQIEAIVLEANRRIEPKIGSLMTLLKATLKDSNQKIVTTTLYTISLLSQATGPQFDKSAKIVIPVILTTLADNKKPVRDEGLKTMDILVNDITLEPFVSFLPVAMAADSSTGRKEVLQWVIKYLPSFKPKATSDIAGFIKPLLACLQDKQGDVRHLAEMVLTETVKHIGVEPVKKDCKDLKPAVQQQLNPILDKIYKSIPAGGAKLTTATSAPNLAATQKPVPEPAPAPATTTTTTTTTTTATAPAPAPAPVTAPATATSIPTSAPKAVPTLSRASTSTTSTTSPGPSSARTMRSTTPGADDNMRASSKSPSPPKSRSPTRMKAKVDDSNIILVPNDQKEERSKKERKLKWAFDEPRPEFIDLLKEQANSCVSTAMHVKMFAADFRLHQKALDDLQGCIEPNKKDTIDNLDVILKWITLRLFDTNLTSLRKTLTYLEALFAMLAAQDFHLSDYEANIFVPFLIDRSGSNSSEPIKLSVRALFKQLCNVYPSSKMFRFVLEGLRSKNWRTRVECLDELSALINRQGLAVCAPSKALPSIATHLADRDPSVRSAALGTFLQAYTYAGEELWKFLGAIPENQRAMLEAHFKRDKIKNDGGDGPAAAGSSPTRSHSSLSNNAGTPGSHSPVKSKSAGNLSIKKEPRTVSPQPISLSPTYAMEIDDEPPSPTQLQVESWLKPLVAADGSFNNELIEMMKVMALAVRQAHSYVPFVDQMVLALTQIGDRAVMFQPPSFRMCKYIFNTLGTMFNQQVLVSAVSQEPLMQLFELVTKVLLDGNAMDIEEEGKQWMSKASNQLILSSLDNCDIINAFTVLLRLMTLAFTNNTYSGKTHEKFTEMVARCLLRITKRLISTAQLLDWTRTIQLLKETNTFLVQHPTGEDITIRAVKTMLTELVRAKGAGVLDHLVGLPASSPVYTYIQYCVKNLTNPNSQQAEPSITPAPQAQTQQPQQPQQIQQTQTSALRQPSPTTQPPQPTFPTQQAPPPAQPLQPLQQPDQEAKVTLRSIFRQISNRETVQQGIQELYQFKKANPLVDLSSHMSQCSEHFQQYIKRALEKLDAGPEEPPSDEMADIFMEKLRNLQSRHGLPTSSVAPSSSPPPVSPTANANTLTLHNTNTPLSITDIKQRIMRSAIDLPAAASVANKENTLENNSTAPQLTSISELKQRIARIKGT